ncbi:MAG: CoA transferase [bacterium]
MESPLSPYRVLDLCGTLGCLTGKILGELGADVIRVEPPGGDSCRMTGPFLDNQPHPERSLSWLAYNSSKRGVTLDITAPKGRALLLDIAAKADFLVESYAPGYLKDLELDYTRLREINPALIHISITPFGQEGPYAGYAAGDLEITALSGAMSLAGEPEGAPMRVTEPQSSQWAGAEAAMAALIALFHRNLTGKGQHVDLSAQAAAMSILAHAPAFWDMLQININRAGAFMAGRNVHGAKMRVFWPVKDGWVNFILYGGNAGVKTNRGLVDWMEAKGGAPDTLKNTDWSRFEVSQASQTEIDEIEHPIGEFFQTLTKAEFLEGVTRREMLGYPVSTTQDIYQDPQLEARDFWQEVYHESLDATLRMPGPFAKFSGAECGMRSPAPGVGQHNREFWVDEMGLEAGEFEMLIEEGVI